MAIDDEITTRRTRPGSSRLGSATRPRVDCWWRTPPGRQPYEPAPTRPQSARMSTMDMDGRPIPDTDPTYPYWLNNQQKRTKKLTKKQLQSSIERLSTPWYMQQRPQSAPPTSMRATAPAAIGGESVQADALQGSGSARPASAMTMPNSKSELAFAWGSNKNVKVLSPSDEAEMIERLYTVKETPQIPPKTCVKLSYEYDGNGYKEVWVPAKTYSQEEATEALVELKKRTDEKIAKLHAKLQDKYMKPLVTSKVVKMGDPEFKEKIELLYRGQGTVKRN